MGDQWNTVIPPVQKVAPNLARDWQCGRPFDERDTQFVAGGVIVDKGSTVSKWFLFLR